MKIKLKAVNLTLTEPLREYVEDKIGSLARFLKKIDLEGAVEIDVEIGRTTRHHHKGRIFMAGVNMRLPGKLLRAEDRNFDIRTAVDKVRDKLQREIEKYKTARSNQARPA